MERQGIQIEKLPELKHPVLIAGFEGWGNALNISKGMVDFLISRLSGKQFAKINPDFFYRYDATRPVVNVEEGVLESCRPPKGVFYSVETEPEARDLVILRADEPNLGWYRFVDELFHLCKALDIKTIITLGGMYDNVLHTDRIISALVSNQDLKSLLIKKKVNPISYHGPSTIHSIIHWEGQKRAYDCISLWCRCPYYIQGTTHFGLLSALGDVLAFLGDFKLDTKSLERNWEKLEIEIQELINTNPQLQTLVDDLKKAKKVTAGPGLRRSINRDEKVINLTDFLEPK